MSDPGGPHPLGLQRIPQRARTPWHHLACLPPAAHAKAPCSRPPTRSGQTMLLSLSLVARRPGIIIWPGRSTQSGGRGKKRVLWLWSRGPGTDNQVGITRTLSICACAPRLHNDPDHLLSRLFSQQAPGAVENEQKGAWTDKYRVRLWLCGSHPGANHVPGCSLLGCCISFCTPQFARSLPHLVLPVLLFAQRQFKPPRP